MADEELAKREAERARKRHLGEVDVEVEADDGLVPHRPESKRQRSVSYDSASSVSSRSVSPQPRRGTDRSPDRRGSYSPVAPETRPARDASPPSRLGRGRVYESDSEESHRSLRSRGVGDQDRGPTHRDLSPRRDAIRRGGSTRESPVSSRGHGSRSEYRGARAHGRSAHSRSPSRSPQRERSRSRSPYQRSDRRYRARDDEGPARPRQQQPTKPTQPPQPPRERSLSPFSKRLALTQAMNMGR